MRLRAIAQGEYYITSDSTLTLLTFGMTECIAVAFIDKANPKNRLLTHMDGMTLSSKMIAKANLEQMIAAFEAETKCTEFETYVLGGRKKFENWENLMAALTDLNIQASKSSDSPEFCKNLNVGKKYQLNPTNADISLICPPDGTEPLFKSFSTKLFIPRYSMMDLEEKGANLTVDELKSFQEFNKANKIVLEHYPEAAKSVRCAKDIQFITNYKEYVEEAKPLFSYQA